MSSILLCLGQAQRDSAAWPVWADVLKGGLVGHGGQSPIRYEPFPGRWCTLPTGWVGRCDVQLTYTISADGCNIQIAFHVLGIRNFLRRSRPLLEVCMSTSQILAFCLNSEPGRSTGERKFCPSRCYVVGGDALHHNKFLYLSDNGAYTWHCCSTHTGALRLAKSDGMLAEPARCRTVAWYRLTADKNVDTRGLTENSPRHSFSWACTQGLLSVRIDVLVSVTQAE